MACELIYPRANMANLDAIAVYPIGPHVGQYQKGGILMATAAMRQCKTDIPAPINVPKGGHAMMHGQNPEFFTKVLLDFLNRHWRL